jgi:hypothetical protein
VGTTLGTNSFAFGLVSDNDTLPERYTGMTARYEERKLGTDRVRFSFSFATYHDQWSGATQEYVSQHPASIDSAAGLYRTRQDFEPAVTVVLAKPLTLTLGAGFQRFETEDPNARFQGSNAAVATLRFHRQVEDSDANKHDVDATYSLRAATRALDSDYAYVRHLAQARYKYKRGRHEMSDEVVAGVITGDAPLFDRFVLGNSSTLRGWNRFDIDPAGGDRVVHNSADYRYRWFETFWDTGAIWSRGETGIIRHSLGAGFRDGAFFVAVAFPVRSARVEPVFMVGMNY